MSADGRAMQWVRRIAAGLAMLVLVVCASAHPMPESLVWIDTAPGGIELTAQLPLNRLEFAFGQPLADHPDQVLARHGDALARYLLNHVGVRSVGEGAGDEGGAGWQVLRPALAIVGGPGAWELQARFVARPPAGADARAPELLFDAVTHEVRTHRVQVFLRNDWSAGFAGQAPLLIGELDHAHNRLPVPLGPAHAGSGMASLFEDGLAHIAGGTDHLLFLLLLLLVAPLRAEGGGWVAPRPTSATLRHTLLVVSAFTLGHTVTLVLGGTGVIAPPQRLIEVAVALTIAAAAVHAWRPLFARAEVWMALGFGLVHGMAFSTGLSGAGLHPWQHAQALFAFNLGIEAMQLVALAVALPPLLMLAAARRTWYGQARRALALLAGVLACVWAAQRAGLADLAPVDALGRMAWLRDGGDGAALPLLLVGLLWLGALACLPAARRCKAA